MTESVQVPAGVVLDQGASTVILEPHPRFGQEASEISDHVIDTAGLPAPAHREPINAPMTTTMMITIRMVFPIPARKPRASSCEASSPASVATRDMAHDCNPRTPRRG
jgi:hypothetical protein